MEVTNETDGITEAEVLKKRRIEEEESNTMPMELPESLPLPSSETRSRAQRYLQVMNSDQILQLILDIAEQIPEALEKIEERAQSDPAHRKLFVRGLSWETTDEQLRAAFSIYGEIEDAAVVMDRTAGKNKGYGFVIFKDFDAAYNALQDPEKEIEGRKTHCNLASLGGLAQQRGRSGSLNIPPVVGAPVSEEDPLRSIEFRKLFIRGLDYNTTAEDVKAVFSEYGDIEECVIPTDRVSGKSKGFAFLTFKQVSAATDALHHPMREIGGRMVNVHLATQTNPRPIGGPIGGPMPQFMGMPPPGPQFMGPPGGGFPDGGFYGGPPRGMPPPGRFSFPPGQGGW